ncbi:SDR family NAD(P)-dependent oxidoreductase [Henriciella mobilis]|uniref:SDR family NAD(P)-dependent oxidoreductase n=1 Tax=Henriciella mobilis TaxID=2305467 RepID=UPI000E6638B8|nr:SDR family NAD(P)-dependent oxidoreductase [Henriciella mobilis]RIJ14079.1 SDR family NAD(P)-dependent oxidoreductase [Henriciella mobilis]
MQTFSGQGALEGHVALVTGAGSGIGKAIVERFCKEGAKCVLVDRDAKRLESMRTALGEVVLPVPGSVASVDTNTRAVDVALSHFGRLDSFICVAGIWDYFRRITDMDVTILSSAFDEIMSVNVKSALLAARVAAPALRKSRGTLILTGSNASFRPGGGGALYAASKFAIRGLVYQLASELAPDIRVNGVAPGGTTTSLTGVTAFGDDKLALSENRKLISTVDAASPLGAAQPEDHTGIYLTLASHALSPRTTGSIFVSDSGLLIR